MEWIRPTISIGDILLLCMAFIGFIRTYTRVVKTLDRIDQRITALETMRNAYVPIVDALRDEALRREGAEKARRANK